MMYTVLVYMAIDKNYLNIVDTFTSEATHERDLNENLKPAIYKQRKKVRRARRNNKL